MIKMIFRLYMKVMLIKVPKTLRNLPRVQVLSCQHLK